MQAAKLKCLISSSGSIYELHWVLPYHTLNSEFANFETPCISENCQVMQTGLMLYTECPTKNLFFDNPIHMYCAY
jgi:hypothetical protein